MPVLHTPAEDLAFIAGKVLPAQTVTVAERDRELVGFIAIDGEWIEHLYVDPRYASRGIGRRLLQHATASMASVRLHCFQSNARARSFYEREGFVAASFGDGSGNEEGLPDILYARER